MRACIVIPTYNEADEIGNLVREIRRQGFTVIVVDDGSSDNTPLVARESGAVVLPNPFNQGKGASLIKGFNYVLNNHFDAVITMDGDGQHLPEDIACFIRLASDSESAIIIGNRMLKVQDMPWIRKATNLFMSWLISILSKQNIPDSQCGFRLIKKDVLERVDLKTCKYETESEILIKAARLGFKITSVPIKTVYGRGKSRIHPLLDTARFIRFLLKYL